VWIWSEDLQALQNQALHKFFAEDSANLKDTSGMEQAIDDLYTDLLTEPGKHIAPYSAVKAWALYEHPDLIQ